MKRLQLIIFRFVNFRLLEQAQLTNHECVDVLALIDPHIRAQDKFRMRKVDVELEIVVLEELQDRLTRLGVQLKQVSFVF